MSDTMSYPYQSMAPNQRGRTLCALLASMLAATACDLLLPPHMTIVEERVEGLVDPDDFRVNPTDYPAYQSIQRIIEPPPYDPAWSRAAAIPMVPIEPEDIWIVTHKFANRLLIFSTDYQERQCRKMVELYPHRAEGAASVRNGRCSNNRDLFYLLITADGRIDGGWKRLLNPQRVLSRSDRQTDLRGAGTAIWGNEPVFRAIK